MFELKPPSQGAQQPQPVQQEAPLSARFSLPPAEVPPAYSKAFAVPGTAAAAGTRKPPPPPAAAGEVQL